MRNKSIVSKCFKILMISLIIISYSMIQPLHPKKAEAATDAGGSNGVIGECPEPVALINGSFEEPEGPGTYDNSVANGGYYYADTVPGWKTTDVWRTPRGIIQIMDPARPSTIPQDTPNQDNLTSRFAELNADQNSMLYQELPTVPGQTIYWRLNHRGWAGVDSMSVNIGPITPDPFNTTPEIQRISTGTTWKTYSGSYTVPEGQTMTRFGFKAISSSTGNVAFGNYLDDVFLGTEPCMTAEKSVSPEGDVFVGDELTYKVTVKNSGGDVAANTVIEDAIPEGTEYVPGSMKIVNGPNAGDLTDEDDNDQGYFDGQKVKVNLGDLPNATSLPDGITIQFKVKALSGYAGKDVANKAHITYKNLLKNEDDAIDSNEVKSSISYKEPVLQSEKSFEIKEKGKDNTDSEYPEVGDTLLYTIKTKNTVPDSLVKNLAISDKLPDGLNYVPDSLKVDGVSVTDAADSDKGSLVNNEILGQFGNVTDTDWHTVEFNVKVATGQAGKDIQNIATVTGDNVDNPGKPSNTVDVYPLDTPIGSCGQTVALINGSFEEGAALGTASDPNGNTPGIYFKPSEVPGWKTTDKAIEIWNYATNRPSGTNTYPTPPNGNRWAELNAFNAGMLYQDVQTTPGQTIYWRLSHMGRSGVDTMQVRIGAVTSNPYDTVVQKQMSDGKTAWGTYTGSYTVPAGQTTTRFGFEAVSSASGSVGNGNFLDNIFLGTEPCVTANKTVSPQGEVHAGDELTYEVQIKNEGGDIASNANFEDPIPAGTEYVPNSIKIINGGITKALTDASDGDEGDFDGNKVNVKLGDLQNTNQLPDGIKVQFKVKTLTDYAAKDVKNKAQVNYKNLLTNKDEQRSSNEVTSSIIYNDPVLESSKTATIKTKGAGNTDSVHPEVGDTLLYTISTKNTVSDSLVKNLIISDNLPDGLTYIPGTLKVDGNSVSDAVDDDKGDYQNGKVEGKFGDIKDTNDHTIQFQAKVQSGQAGKDIQNIASVTGDNVNQPSNPEEEVKVYPRKPVLESEKTAKNLETGKDTFEVGDTVVYTIKTHNQVSDGIVQNLTISDQLPEGLEYLIGSMKVDGKTVTDIKDLDEGYFENNTVTGVFGNVTDTSWHTVEFRAKILSGQSEKAIENIASVSGGNINQPDEPSITVEVDPKAPKLESNKTATIQQKAAENKDTDHPEVGDTLLYKITTKNTVSDSLVENLVLSDNLPDGLEYVPDSLKVDGKAVSDAVDEDKGSYQDGKVEGQVGDVRDTNEHTLEFLVKVASGQAGKDIQNIATVTGDNVDNPSTPEEVVKVYPRDPVLESEKTAKNLEEGKDSFEVGDTVVYTIKTHNKVSEGVVKNLTISDTLPAGLKYVSGSLQVDGKSVTDAKDDDNGYFDSNEVSGQFGDVTDTDWHTVEFQAKIVEGQSEKAIENIAKVSGGNIEQPDQPKTTVKVDPKAPLLESHKTATIQQKAADNKDADHPEVGDTLLYTITTKNTVSDSLVKNLVISDNLPDGLEYVSGSLKVDGLEATDAQGDDKGFYQDGKVEGQVGDVTDTNEHTIQFLVKIKAGQASKDIQNVASVTGDNVNQPSTPEEVVKVYPRNPVLESEKTVKNLEADKDIFEVGDTVVYTIKTRNKVSDGVVQNLTISDQLPEGLEYLIDSMKVDGKTVTDMKDLDEGNFENNTVTGVFGNVTDTAWHTVEFQAKVKSGQNGNTITNVAQVTGDNVEKSNNPSKDVDVINHKPSAPDDHKTTPKDTPVSGKVEATDPDGDPLTYKEGNPPSHGTVEVHEDGTWTYTPDKGYTGNDSFTVIVDDGKGGQIEVPVTVDITEPDNPPAQPNNPPTAPDEHKTTSKDTPVSGKVEATDPDGDPLTYKEGNPPSHGTVEVHEDGTWTYTPDKGYTGNDSFTVIVDDGKGGKIEVPVTVTITEPENPPAQPNNPPTAPDEHKTTTKDTPVSGKVKGSDPDGDPLTYKEGKPPSHGTVEVHEDGTWTYTPDKGYTGNDSFTVIVEDGKGGQIEVPVTVTITKPDNPPTKPNNPPKAPDEHKTTSKDTPVSGKVKGSDPDGDSLTYKEGKPPSHGTVEVHEDGTWTYTPDKGYTGSDSFTVIVEDGKGGKIEVPVTVTISETNNPPSGGDNHNNSNNPPESEHVKGPEPDGKPLPKTGDTDSFATIMGGIVLLLAGGILSLRINRRKNA